MDNNAPNPAAQTDADKQAAAEAASKALLLTSKGGDSLKEKLMNLESPHLTSRDYKFTFRKTKDEVTGEDIKKPTLSLVLPVPTFAGLVDSLGDQKIVDYVLDVIADQVKAAARVQIDDESTPVGDQEHLDLSKLTLEFLANQPKAERTGGGISKELWEGFGKDYMEVMPAVTGRSAEIVNNGLQLFLKRYSTVRQSKDVLKKLQGLLATYSTSTKNLEEYADVVEYLEKRAETLLKADETALLDSLG